MSHLEDLKSQVSHIHKINKKLNKVEYLNESIILNEFDLKNIVSKINPMNLISKMKDSLKDASKNPDVIKKINSLKPSNDFSKKLFSYAIKGKEDNFKQSVSYFKSFFKNIKDDKIITNLSNSMACVALAMNKGEDIKETNKVISKKIELVFKEKDINESTKITEVFFPTIAVTPDDVGQQTENLFLKVINLCSGILQAAVQCFIIIFASIKVSSLVSEPAGYATGILMWLALWGIWHCLPENRKDWSIFPVFLLSRFGVQL